MNMVVGTGSAASGAPTDAQYVTLAVNATLIQERVLTGSANGTLYGGGAFASGNQSVGSGDSLSVRVTTYAGAA